MKYSDKLKDPRWQRRKSEVQHKANFTCEDCGSTTKTLHVHHCFYVTGRDPWEYDDDLLMLLCDECHPRRQNLEQQAHIELARKMRNMTIYELERFVMDPLDMQAKRDHAISSGDIDP